MPVKLRSRRRPSHVIRPAANVSFDMVATGPNAARETNRAPARQSGMPPIDEGISMPTLCRAYTTEADAHDAVRRLLAAGVPEAGIRVLMGEAVRDARRSPVGGFAGAAAVQRRSLGSFAGADHAQDDGMGAFEGDAGHARRGGFGDVDRDTVAELVDGVEHLRVASHDSLEKLLVDAGLDPVRAAADVEALHAGRVLVLATPDGDAEAAAAALAAD
jgi:hypothetical protein